MKVLFAALHLAHYRNFESVIRELAGRGHQVHLTGDESESLGGEALARRLAGELPGVTWGLLPSLEPEPWFDTARRMRVSLDYVRALDPIYPAKVRLRTEERTSRIVRWSSRVPFAGPWLTRSALTRFERLMPPGEALVRYLEAHAPDLVVLTSLTYSRSQQLDLLKAARAREIPVAAAIMSWDHLSSKALLHVQPDCMLVWNDVQKREAGEMHGFPADRVVVTGAQCYDQWFTRAPVRSREAFCATVGLRPDRPFALWVHSALSPTPVPPEPALVMRWIAAVRASADPRLRDLGVLVRPHPERLKEWAGISFDGLENVAFHGRNPIDGEARDDYFDSLYYSSAVVGLVTSAFLEAAIVGRPVLTFTLPEYRMHQDEMIHFRYLMSVEGGLLLSAPDLDAHLRQLSEAVALGGARDERNRRFLHAFVRPNGLDRPATPAFADALERMVRAGTQPDPSLQHGMWLRPAAVALASWSRVGVARWLTNDLRADEWDERDDLTERAVATRVQAKEARRREKLRQREWRRRQNLALAVGKKIRRTYRSTRRVVRWAAHRSVTTMYRGLSAARLRRGGIPGGGSSGAGGVDPGEP
jgi:hypothetical protein